MATTITREPFGYRLREARLAAGLTQKELAARVGRTYQAIQHWEDEDSNITPRSTSWPAIERALKLKRGTIYRWVDEDPKTSDHPPATSGMRCSPLVVGGLRKHLHVTLPAARDTIA